MSEDERDADEFMGHPPPPPPAAPRPDASGMYTLTGEARNVRPFTEDVGWGEHRHTIQVVSFTLDQFVSGRLDRSVYAEIRGRSVARRPVENEVVTVTGRFADGRLQVHTLAGVRDDPALPIHQPGRRWRRRLLVPFGCLAVVLLCVCGGPLGLFGFVLNATGMGSHMPALPIDVPGVGGTPHEESATGPGPWTITGAGYLYELVSATRATTTPRPGETVTSVTVRGFVTRSRNTDFTAVGWGLRNEGNFELQRDDGSSIWEEAPTVGQRLPITLVVVDSKPGATTLTLTVTDFYRKTEPLILHDIPVT